MGERLHTDALVDLLEIDYGELVETGLYFDSRGRRRSLLPW